MSQSKLESVQTNLANEKRLAEQEKRLAEQEKRLAEQEERLAEQEKRLAEQERYQHEMELLLLQAQTAGWFAADQCGHCMSNVQPLQFPDMSLPQKLRQVSVAGFANVAVCKPLLSALLYNACCSVYTCLLCLPTTVWLCI